MVGQVIDVDGKWHILRLLTGERVSSIVNVEISLDELNASFIHDRKVPDLEPFFPPNEYSPRGLHP